MNSINSPATKAGIQPRRWFDFAWLVLLILFLSGFCASIVNGEVCKYLATDFRGYYASGVITEDAGLASVYDPQLQAKTQATLFLNCPDGSTTPPRLQVMVPYLPVFIVPFQLLPRLNFSTSYLIWCLLSVLVLIFYLYRFLIALPASRIDSLRLFQWVLCFPLFANLMLGQINVALVIALGEFVLALRRDKTFWGGVWLATLLIKPHVLILLLPGLLISRRWKALIGFGVGATVILAASLLLVGLNGLEAWMAVVRSFTATSFYSVPDMMNTRGLAYNLSRSSPTWFGVCAAATLTVATVLLVLNQWRKPGRPESFFWLMLATLAGTCLVSWHANLYLWIILIPFLLALDLDNHLPRSYLAIWVFGPATVFSLGYLVNPELAQPALASAMLAVNFALVIQSYRRQTFNPGMKS